MARCKLEMYNTKETADRICGNNSVGIFVAETFARYADKYVPMDTGMLAQTYTTTPFKVTYNQPYAHRMFYGESFDFNKEKHPLATARWDIATNDAYSNQISKEVTAYIRRQ